MTVIAEHGRRTAAARSAGGGGGRFGLAFSRRVIEGCVDEAVHAALTNPNRARRPGRRDDRGARPGWPGVLLHEAVGHGLEGDFNRKGSSAFSGRIGQRVAAKGVTVLDDGTMPTAAARSTSTTRPPPRSATC